MSWKIWKDGLKSHLIGTVKLFGDSTLWLPQETIMAYSDTRLGRYETCLNVTIFVVICDIFHNIKYWTDAATASGFYLKNKQTCTWRWRRRAFLFDEVERLPQIDWHEYKDTEDSEPKDSNEAKCCLWRKQVMNKQGNTTNLLPSLHCETWAWQYCDIKFWILTKPAWYKLWMNSFCVIVCDSVHRDCLAEKQKLECFGANGSESYHWLQFRPH